MNPLDNLKRQIVDSVASRALDRMNVRNETRAYTSQDIHTMLEYAAMAAIEQWNGHIQAEINIIQVDFENRLRITMTKPTSFDPSLIIDPENYRK